MAFSLSIGEQQVRGEFLYEDKSFDFFNYLPTIDYEMSQAMKCMLLHQQLNAPPPTLKDIVKVTRQSIAIIFKELCKKFFDLQNQHYKLIALNLVNKNETFKDMKAFYESVHLGGSYVVM